jgi:DNA-binding MarR family transcriptional regulator
MQPPTSDTCAHQLLETIPSVMTAIRAEMRACRASGLSVPQFRGLVFVDRNPGTSLSGVAEYLGLSLPSTSKLINMLVKRSLVARHDSEQDRRKITLALTPDGQASLEQTQHYTRQTLAQTLDVLSEAERLTLSEAMRTLERLFCL